MSSTDSQQAFLHSCLEQGTSGPTLLRGVEVLREVRELKRLHGSHFRIILCYTSNLISSGVRDVLAWLLRHPENLIDVVITTAGGAEEDCIKCLGPTVIGAFDTSGVDLRKQGLNRVGNLLIPNQNYVLFESFFCPILTRLAAGNAAHGGIVAPSSVLRSMGEKLQREHPDSAHDSVCVAASARGVPIYCPAFTDGSMGDMSFFFGISNPDALVIDPLIDFDALVRTMQDASAGLAVVCFGAGLPRHHALMAASLAASLGGICRITHALFVDSAPADGLSESGSTIAQYVDRGCLSPHSTAVRIELDATIAAPFLVQQAFAS